MTDRFLAFKAALDQRDTTLTQLAIIGLVIVLAYVLVDRLPKRIQPRVRGVYLVGGAGLYGITLLVSVGGILLANIGGR